ncbi:hypothetical protein A4H97_33945 [Niastella yeongjuensis]|uniref:Uncharacterized protein n=1 Tax=Niastella yeongjuensis TaxID=354355 RepID=A0A1V9EBC9_9BACT|nr:hypothetical protein A4H97_33945 [Niastella yeongjuensis]SEO75277.1 hypothetical protein SAMN05660816_03420 [Niastella yeongjuensis]
MNFRKTQWCDENQTILHCPVCQFEYVHLMKITPVQSEDRLGVVLEFECEEGHQFSSLLHNHKGYMVSEITNE